MKHDAFTFVICVEMCGKFRWKNHCLSNRCPVKSCIMLKCHDWAKVRSHISHTIWKQPEALHSSPVILIMCLRALVKHCFLFSNFVLRHFCIPFCSSAAIITFANFVTISSRRIILLLRIVYYSATCRKDHRVGEDRGRHRRWFAIDDQSLKKESPG